MTFCTTFDAEVEEPISAHRERESEQQQKRGSVYRYAPRAWHRWAIALALVGTYVGSLQLPAVEAQEGFAPPPLTIPPQSATIHDLPISRWLTLVEAASGKRVTYPSSFGNAEEARLRFMGNLRALNYPVVKAVLEANGYQVTEELRSNLIQVRHYSQRVRSRVTKRPAPSTEVVAEVVEPSTLTWLCPLRYLDAASTYDTIRQVLRRRNRDGKESAERLRAELVTAVNALVLSGDDETIRRIQDLIRTLDIPPITQLPLLRCFTPYHADAAELAERIHDVTRFPVTVLGSPESEVLASSPGADRHPNANGRYCRVLVLPRLEKLLVETNDQDVLELVDFLMPLIDRRDASARAGTYLYHVEHIQVEVAVKSLWEFIRGGGIPRNLGAEGEAVSTRIITHERTNSILIQASPELYEQMKQFLDSIDSSREASDTEEDAPG